MVYLHLFLNLLAHMEENLKIGSFQDEIIDNIVLSQVQMRFRANIFFVELSLSQLSVFNTSKFNLQEYLTMDNLSFDSIK